MSEKDYTDGRRMSLIGVVRHCLRELGTNYDISKLSMITEREEAISKPREICEEHGDNDWPNDLHLVDILEKHLLRHLDE